MSASSSVNVRPISNRRNLYAQARAWACAADTRTGGGDRAALDRLIPLVYDELRTIASRHVCREWRQGALQATALASTCWPSMGR